MNTIENKEKLFAQYWGKNVATVLNPFSNEFIEGCKVDTRVADIIQHLSLKPLSSISDEDYFEIYGNQKLVKKKEKWVENVKEIDFEVDDFMPSKRVDYLRSKGYALPYLGISVEDQVKFGWIKLEE